MSELTGTFVAQIANSLGAFQSIWKKAGNLNSLRNGNCQIIQGNIIKLHCLHHKMSIVFKDMSREIREKLNDFTLAGLTGNNFKKNNILASWLLSSPQLLSNVVLHVWLYVPHMCVRAAALNDIIPTHLPRLAKKKLNKKYLKPLITFTLRTAKKNKPTWMLHAWTWFLTLDASGEVRYFLFLHVYFIAAVLAAALLTLLIIVVVVVGCI